ncbi:MAG: helix-turn-helix domain-containing protein [Candidatus Acidiferrales bacterium]
MNAGTRLALNEAGPPLVNVSTNGVTLSERREFWESGASFLFGALRLEEQSREPFDANFSYASIGDLVFCQLATRVPHRVFRTQAVASHDDRPFLKAVLQTKGRSVIAQSGRTTPLYSGEWTFYDAGQPYSVALSAGSEFSMLLVPRGKVVSRGFDLRGLVLRRFSSDRGLGKLIWNLVGNTVDQIPDLQNRVSFDLAEIVAQMTRLAVLDCAEGDNGHMNSCDALRERVKFYISAYLNDPELSIDKLAGLAHCSKRYLHMLFRTENLSISEYILRARLERCRAELLDPGLARRSITEIAYAWGFNSSNHFSRCFKHEFGVSPRDLRSHVASWPLAPMSSVAKPS